MLAIQKWGNSQGIRIPKKYLKELNLQIGDKFDLIAINSQFVLKPIKPKKRKSKLKVSEIFNMDMDNEEFEWGKEGKEVW